MKGYLDSIPYGAIIVLCVGELDEIPGLFDHKVMMIILIIKII